MEKDLFTKFPKRLKQTRELRNCSQNKLSKLTGISQPLISRYESEKHSCSPTSFNLHQLCDVLKVTPEYLLGVEEELSLNIDTKQIELKKIENFSSESVHKVFDYFRIPADKPSNFFLQNEDDSLSPHIQKDDLLFFTNKISLKNDDIILMKLKGTQDRLLRVYEKKSDKIYLLASKAGCKTLELTRQSFNDEYEIMGVLVGFWRVVYNLSERGAVV